MEMKEIIRDFNIEPIFEFYSIQFKFCVVWKRCNPLRQMHGLFLLLPTYENAHAKMHPSPEINSNRWKKPKGFV